MEHCEEGYVGDTVGIDADDCEVLSFGDLDGWTGEVSADGGVFVTGPVDDDVVACEGQLSSDGSAIRLTCDGPCTVALELE